MFVTEKTFQRFTFEQAVAARKENQQTDPDWKFNILPLGQMYVIEMFDENGVSQGYI